MRGVTRTLALALLPALGLIACAEQAGQEGAAGEMEMSMEMNPMELRSSIESLAGEFEAAVTARDGDALAAMYATDATLLPDDAEIVRDHAGIREFWTGFLAELPDGATVDLKTVDVQGAGNLAYEIGRFSLSAEGESLGEGKYLVVWRHEADGSWKMVADIWNGNESPEM